MYSPPYIERRLAMRICILSQYPPQVGGIAVHCSELARELKNRGHTVHVITYGRMGRGLRGEIRIHEMPVVNRFMLRGSLYLYFTLRTLNRIRESEGIDIVHAHPLYPAGLAASIFKRNSKTPFVATSHGSDLLRWSSLGIAKRLFPRIANSAGRLICVSGYLAKKAAELGVSKGRLEVVYNWIDRSGLPTESASSLRKRLMLPQGRKIVLFTGALADYKGPDLLLDMARGIDADFLFIGRGPMLKSLKGRARWKGITNAHFLGDRPHRTCLKYMKASDLVAVPSRMEGFGITALEAMSLGVPVLANPVGGLREVLPGECLRLDRESMVRILEDENYAARLASREKRKAKSFDMSKSVRRIESIYREVAGV